LRYISKDTMFPKNNMVGDSEMMTNGIITLITLLSFSIAKEAIEMKARL
jgi:hypothetical protein